MSVKVEKTENKNELKLEFTVEAKVFDAGIKKVFEKNAKYFNIPGFRKGKAPMNIVEKFYGDEIFYEDAFNEVVPEVYESAIKEEKLDVVSKPDIQVTQIGKGKDLIFTAVVQTKPEVKLGKYKGIELEKSEHEVTEDSIKHELDQMAERNARMVSVTDRAAEKGDTAVIDFVGTVDGVAFEGGKAENHELELGSGSFIPGFEDQVIGMKIDENKDVKVKFPEEYFSKELAGKDAVFNVTVHEIKKKELPKLDDEFAKDVSEFDSLEELKADIKAKQEKDNEARTKSELEEAAVKAVTDLAEVDIPSGMVEIELDNMVEDMNRRLSYQGVSFEQYLNMIGKKMADFRKESEESAKSSVKMRLVLEAIFNDAKLAVEEAEIDSKVKELAEAYGRKEDELKANTELMKNIKNSLETEKAINYIVENAKVGKATKKATKTAKTEKVEKADKEAKETKETKKADKAEKTEKKTTKKATK